MRALAATATVTISIHNTKIVYVYLLPSGLGCDLEFGFGSFKVKNFVKLRVPIIKMFERRLPGRSAIVGFLDGVNRAGKRAARRAARIYTRLVHVHQAAEPSSPASPTPLHAHIPTTDQENVRMVPCLAARRQQCAARRYSPQLSGALAISLFISGIYLCLVFIIALVLSGVSFRK